MYVDRRKNRLATWVLFTGLAFMGTIVIILCGYKIQRLQMQVEVEIRRHLEQTSSDVHAMVSAKMEDSIRALETTADVVADYRGAGIPTEFLATVAQGYQFEQMGVLSPDGVLTATDGVTVDLSAEPFVQHALAGDGTTLGIYQCPLDPEPAIVYTVPILRGDRRTATLVALISRTAARDYLGTPGAVEDCRSAIIDSAGTVVLAEEGALKETENFYALLERGETEQSGDPARMREDVAAGRTGLLYCTLDGVESAMIYTPLNISDWYLLSVVPVHTVSSGLQSLIGATVLIDVVTVVLFISLIVAATLLSRSNIKRIEEIAFVDPVTGGANRAGFLERAGVLLRAAQPRSYAMVSMDLDRFKLINETYGTEHGDKTLWHVYRSVASQLGPDEAVGRVASDIFSILLKNSSREELTRRLSGIADKINEFNNTRKEKYFLPVYQGVYVVEDPALEIITAQDRANAARKSNRKIRQGRLSACTFYDDLFSRVMRREKEIDDRMESALENGEFVVYLQPKVELNLNTAVGAEALVRWIDPERGLIPPDEFIRLFEKNGFIIKLDLFVFEQVCRLLRRWMDEGKKVVPISVNVSRVHMENLNFLNYYERVRAKYNVPAELIEFELTETVVMDNMQALRNVMDQMHSLGFRCSLDDFGSGYSSLNVLKDMPVDTIKLDRAFFAGKDDGERGEHVVESILELARKLSIETVCEGVEDPRQVDFLRIARCDMVQGFVFSRPVPVADFEPIAFGGKPVPCKEMEKSTE